MKRSDYPSLEEEPKEEGTNEEIIEPEVKVEPEAPKVKFTPEQIESRRRAFQINVRR